MEKRVPSALVDHLARLLLKKGFDSCPPLTRRAAWAFASVQSEAQSLFRLIGTNRETADTLRQLISIPPRELSILQALAVRSPDLSRCVERAIEFRQQVLEEFDRLVAKNVPLRHAQNPEAPSSVHPIARRNPS